ncbi:MAG: Molybdopterin molybdenumtransferase [Candidatus Heimdallarchaeota archaeon LC_3]|nr:MAG: Molybdopterin molybdenumtransferase [Candidatus Heimdallarchaeota archaeon LC_3]
MFPRIAKWTDVQKILNERISPLSRVEKIPIFEALHRISIVEIESELSLPQFNRSLVDGFAISNRTSEKELKWKIIGETKIGFQSEFKKLKEKESVYVPTGGIIPHNCHSVVKIEDSLLFHENNNKFITILKLPNKNTHIELSGSDITVGQTLIEKNTFITPQIISLLSSVGINEITVNTKPRITVIVTGHEIIPPGEKLELGQVYDSTSALLISLIKTYGGLISNFHRTGESKEEIIEKIISSLNTSDLIVTTGGTSVGKADNVAKAVEDLGEVIFHGINIRPGKPVLFGKIKDIPLIGFPGFVTSTAVIANLFFPIIFQKLFNIKKINPKVLKVKNAKYLKAFTDWHRIIPGYLSDGVFYSTFKTSSAISSYADSEGYIILDPEDSDLPEGKDVIFIYYINWLK